MENVYDIRKDKKLNFILPDRVLNNENTVLKKGDAAVFIHLHYADTVEKYFGFICNIPKQIDVYISCAKTDTKEVILEQIKKGNLDNCTVIDKENRGRDVSALLVTFRTIILRYRFFCFIHDKKAKGEFDREYKNEWIESMWINMLASEEYIYNVKNVFDDNASVGILSVPEPYSLKYNAAFDNSWCKNYDIAVKLAEKLQLKCSMDKTVPPVTLGTVFWGRTVSLHKLLQYPWKYEDFPEEPMPNDGTISHAIERLFAYVAQDAGYTTGTIRTIQNAEYQLGNMQYYLFTAFEWLKKDRGIWNIEGLLCYESRMKKCIDFAKRYETVYLYGAGMGGKLCLRMLTENKIIPQAFLVTEVNNEDVYMNLPVIAIKDAKFDDAVGVIVATGEKNKEDIFKILQESDCKNYIWIMERE